MNKAIAVVTWGGNFEETFPRFITSLSLYRKYPLIVILNECNLLSYDARGWLHDNFHVLENEENLWECGAIASVMHHTDVDEFVFLQDTMEIEDPAIFAKMFDEFEGKSVAFGNHWWCYLGKYRRAVLEQIRLPKTKTKKHAMYQEVALVNEILKIEPVITSLFPEWGDNNPRNWKAKKFGRENLVLSNPYILKYKGTVASDKPGAFTTTNLTWEDLQKDWEETGEYY